LATLLARVERETGAVGFVRLRVHARCRCSSDEPS
jgi:hypothetical protein